MMNETGSGEPVTSLIRPRSTPHPPITHLSLSSTARAAGTHPASPLPPSHRHLPSFLSSSSTPCSLVAQRKPTVPSMSGTKHAASQRALTARIERRDVVTRSRLRRLLRQGASSLLLEDLYFGFFSVVHVTLTPHIVTCTTLLLYGCAPLARYLLEA
jgi:hypothetical protein